MKLYVCETSIGRFNTKLFREISTTMFPDVAWIEIYLELLQVKENLEKWIIPAESQAQLQHLKVHWFPCSGPCWISDRNFNTLRPRRNGPPFTDYILKRIFLNENVWIWVTISPKFVPKCPINNITALVQVMAWCRPGDKPLSEPMMISLPRHICVARPQWVDDRPTAAQNLI